MATRTYYGTTFNPDLTKATIHLYIHDTSKYDRDSNVTKTKVTGVKSWTLVAGGADAEHIEALGVEEDKCHEYLVLNYVDGRTEIYPNLKVAMFVL